MPQQCLPWQGAQREAVLDAWRRGHLPHALLLNGPPGMGKRAFAEDLAQTLLCRQPAADGTVCGQCKSCHLLVAGNHPDLRRIEPEAAGKQIKIDQVRELIGYCNLTSNYDGYKVILLQPAEAMNVNAANGLLKLLEEPPPQTLLVLVSDQAHRLPATIRSRCQRLEFKRAEAQPARAWLEQRLGADAPLDTLLQLARHAPLAALALAGQLPHRRQVLGQVRELLQARADPVALAEEWVKLGADAVLGWLLSWTQDLLRRSYGPQWLHNRDLAAELCELLPAAQTAALFALLEQELDAYRLLGGTTNVKAQGVLESVALAWLELGVHTRRT